VREGIQYFREAPAADRRAAALGQAQAEYEAAPLDELVLPITRTGEAVKGPGGLYYLGEADVPLLTAGYGYDGIALRARRSILLVAPAEADFPETWSALFYERVSWPPQPTAPGQHLQRRFLQITRLGRSLRIPVHDHREEWTGVPYKVRPLPGTAADQVPISGYIVLADSMSKQNLCAWLTMYLAQHRFLTPNEETHAVESFIARGRGIGQARSARLLAYERARRRYVQPLRGEPSFPSYLKWATRGAIRDQVGESRSLGLELHAESNDAWTVDSDEDSYDASEPVWTDDDQEDSVEPPMESAGSQPSLVELKSLRWSEPRLHRAILDRIRAGSVQVIELDGKEFVSAADAHRVDSERERNAAEHSKAGFDRRQRAIWEYALKRGQGLSRSAARRKLARWINEFLLSAEEISASIAQGKLVRFRDIPRD
jgi:hypothetical protein